MIDNNKLLFGRPIIKWSWAPVVLFREIGILRIKHMMKVLNLEIIGKDSISTSYLQEAANLYASAKILIL